MKTLSHALIFFVSFIIFFQVLSGSDGEFTEITGYVYDTSIKYIKNARIEIKNLSGEDDEKGHGYYVTYSDEEGRWKMKVPFSKLIMVKTYSNGFIVDKTTIDMEMERSLNNLNPIVRSRMKKGVSHIEWGSFEHYMTYVRPSYQKEIEKISNSRKPEKIENFINQSVKKYSIKDVFGYAGYICFRKGDLKISKEFFNQAGSKIWFNLMGNKLLQEGKYMDAFDSYMNGITTRSRADDLIRLAEAFENKNEKDLKIKCYAVAMADFSRMIIDYRYNWSEDLLRLRYECSQHLPEESVSTESDEIREILIKAGEYCKKLKQSEIYFYCVEEKKDKVVLIEDLHEAVENPEKYFENFRPSKLRGTKITDKYIYDLQFIINDKGVVEESRRLVNEYPDMIRNTVPVLSYKVVRPLYGPNTLIGFGWQNFSIIKFQKEQT